MDWPLPIPEFFFSTSWFAHCSIPTSVLVSVGNILTTLGIYTHSSSSATYIQLCLLVCMSNSLEYASCARGLGMFVCCGVDDIFDLSVQSLVSS